MARTFSLSLEAQLLIASLVALGDTGSTQALKKSGNSLINSTIIGSLSYSGTWDASTNTPTIVSGVGTLSQFYKVSVAGNTTIDGNTGWAVGDWIIFNGSTWDKIDNTELVTSVAGKIGAVTLVLDDNTDVTITSAASGDFLRYSGSAWVDSTIQASDIPSGVDALKIGAGVVSNTEFGYLDGVTSAIQTQMDLKSTIASPTFTGTVTMPSPFTLGSTSVTTTGTQLNYLNTATGISGTGNVVLNLDATLGGVTKFLGTASTTLTDITGALRTGSIVLTSPYLDGGYSNALYFSSNTYNPGIPKAGIWAKMTSAGSQIHMGTSASYATGITNTALIIDQNGNVLINHATPKTGSGVTPILQVEGDTYNTSSIGLFHNSTTSTTFSSVIIGRSRGTTAGSQTLVQSGDYLGGVYFTGADGTVSSAAGAILCIVDGTAGAGDMPGRVEIQTTTDGTIIPITRMVINNQGVVTLGTTNGTGTGDFYPGRIILNGNQSFTAASSNAYIYHSTALGLVMYGNGSGDDFTLAGSSGANILSVATGTTTARFYGAVNIGGTFTRRTISGVASQFQVEGVGFDASSASLSCNDSGTASACSVMFFNRSRGSAVNSNTIVQNGDRLGLILFTGTDGSIPVPGAIIQAYVDGTPGSSDMPGRLEFLTTPDGSTSPTLRLTIDSAGNSTFTGAIAINNTVAAGVAVASTHKVTVVIGGNIYYLLASNV